jgi:hypothetical protein
MPQSEPDFVTLLRGARRSAVHLEMRDAYMLDDPDLIAWRQGYRADPADRTSWWRPWLDLVTETVERGVVLRRARIVSEPVSEYIRYEYDVTFPNVAAGEQVRWLPRRQSSGLALPGNDFWLIDDRLVQFHFFSGDGQWADPGFEITEEPGAAKLCALAFDAVWERGIPHEKYIV